MTITLHLHRNSIGLFYFDDDAVGLWHELFVDSATAMLDAMAAEAGMLHPEALKVTFSQEPFREARFVTELKSHDEVSEWSVYGWRGHDADLCPALLRYFERPPRFVYMQLEPAEHQKCSD